MDGWTLACLDLNGSRYFLARWAIGQPWWFSVSLWIEAFHSISRACQGLSLEVDITSLGLGSEHKSSIATEVVSFSKKGKTYVGLPEQSMELYGRC